MYQTLFLIRDGYVSLQKDDYLYFDTVENFKLDGAVIPDNISNIDYVPDNKQCIINNEAFQEYPNQFAETCLNNIESFLNAQQQRLIPEPKILTFEELKESKLQELDTYSHKFDNQLVCDEMVINSSLGFLANADLRSQNNVDGLISTGLEPVDYCDAKNEFHSLTLEQLKILKNEFYLNGQSLYKQKWELKTKITEATNKEDLDKIEIKFTMLDFTK